MNQAFGRRGPLRLHVSATHKVLQFIVLTAYSSCRFTIILMLREFGLVLCLSISKHPERLFRVHNGTESKIRILSYTTSSSCVAITAVAGQIWPTFHTKILNHVLIEHSYCYYLFKLIAVTMENQRLTRPGRNRGGSPQWQNSKLQLLYSSAANLKVTRPTRGMNKQAAEARYRKRRANTTFVV